MNYLLDFAKKLPLEVYVILLTFLVGLILFLVNPLLNFGILKYIPFFSSFYLFIGFEFLFAVVVLFFSYFLVKIFLIAVDYHKEQKKVFLELGVLFGNIAIPLITLTAVLSSLFFVTVLLTYISPESVFEMSRKFMFIDQRISGPLSPFSIAQYFSQWSSIDWLLVFVYANLGLVITLSMIVFFIANTQILRKFLLTLFVVCLLSVPFWYEYPVISPYELYMRNIFQLDSSDPFYREAKEIPLASSNYEFLKYSEGVGSNVEKGTFLVTTFPSMHIAWGTLVAFYVISLLPLSAIIVIPWWIVNTISVVYTLQHYTIDIPAGIIAAFVTMFIVHRALLIEKKYYKGKNPPLYIIDAIREEFKRFYRTIAKSTRV